MSEDMTLEQAVEQFLKTKDEWEEAWQAVFMRWGRDLGLQEARQKIGPTGLAFLLDDWIDDDTISNPRDYWKEG